MRRLGSSLTSICLRFLLGALALALAACRAQPPPQTGASQAAANTRPAFEATTAEPSSTPSAAGEPARTPSPLPGKPDEAPAEAAPARPAYNLSAVLDYGRHHLAVEELITYPNRSGEPLEDLLLLVEPTRYPSVFHLNSLALSPSGAEVEDYTLDIGQLRIRLPQPLPPGEAITLELAYELDLPSPDADYYGRPIPFGYTSRQTNLVDWYPYLPPYVSGEGWLAHQAGFFGEHLAYESADFQVRIRLEDDRPELTVAASAPATRDGDWRVYRLDAARNFAWSVSHLYTVTSTSVGDVEVLGYAFPAHAESGAVTLQVTAEALALYNDLFGAYPHQTLSVVEADFLDGMEFDGLYFLSNAFYNLYRGGYDDYLTAIAAHETSHQWWYGLVGNDQALEPWLDEALATYSERLYYERLHPEALDWWWVYRINYYEPRGWVDGSIYNPEGYRAYRDAVYLNGAEFLEALRDQIGDQAFLAILKQYATENARQIATGEDFFHLLKPYAGEDLTHLIARYFAQPVDLDP